MECTIDWMARERHGVRGRNRQRPRADDGRRAGRRRAQPGAAADGDGAGRHRRLHRLRRGADPQARPPRRARLPVQAHRRARDRPTRRCSRAIHMHFIVSGARLPAAAVERAIALSHEKYCSATSCWQDGRDHDQLRDRRGLTPASQASDVVRGRGHHLGRRRASPAHRRGSAARAGLLGRVGVARPRRPSSARRSRARRDRRPAAGRGGRARCASTWRSVSTTKPRLTRSPSAAGHQADAEGAGVPERIEQARAARRVRRSRSRGPGEVVGLLARRPARTARAAPGRGVASAWALYSAWAQTSPTWLTRINAPDSLARPASAQVRCIGARATAALACAPPDSVRSASSAA